MQGETKALRDAQVQKYRAFETLKQKAKHLAVILEKQKADDSKSFANRTGICPASVQRMTFNFGFQISFDIQGDISGFIR
jgi:hypothetical protein